MTAELGQFATILALLLALIQSSLPLLGTINGNQRFMKVAHTTAWGQFIFLTIAITCLGYAMLSSDFSVRYVAATSSRDLPDIYKITAIWGGHEGALLLWTYIFSIWCVAVSVFSKSIPLAMSARVLAVMGMVAAGFLLFILLTSSPFERLAILPLDGNDLNPLLQDPGMIIHPPMLYIGYSGFSVAFAFAIAALLSGRFDAAWARWSRPWTLVAWVFLTLGISLGSWWAYHELGWGGWWFWDPVENASFMPWLAGTALIHSLAVAEKRGAFKSWTILLAISAFSLSLLGTFLVRSGVLTSVHSFANDPARGLFILVLLCLFIGSSLALFAWRAPTINRGSHFTLYSKETALLLNNLFLAALTAIVLFGTLAPLIYSAFDLGKISVGFPWFNLMFVIITPAMFILMGLGPLLKWKKHAPKEILQQVKWLALGAAVFFIAGCLPLLTPEWSIKAGLGLGLTAWITLTIGKTFINHRRQFSNTSMVQDIAGRGRSFYGMLTAHIGMAMLILGVTFVSIYDNEKDVSIRPGEKYTINNYQFEFKDIRQLSGPNYTSYMGEFEVRRNERLIATLRPEKRTYNIQKMPMTEAGIKPGLFRDVYVSLGEDLGDDAWAVRLYYKPMVRFIWLGSIFMAIGGLLSISDRRYRVGNKGAGFESVQLSDPA